jgi:peptidoglycan hydrolase CwlO-like protein
MKKLLILVLAAGAVVAFVGTDVVRGALHKARDDIRSHLTAQIPLEQQLAEAQALVDSYAESVIKGEVAADNLAEMITQVEREVRGLDSRVATERQSLVSLRRDLEVVPTSTAPRPEDHEAVRRAAAFKAEAQLLDRRKADLARLRKEHATTQTSLQEARSEQQRLSQEVQVLAAELESLQARTAAARTRKAVGDATVDSSGYAEARKKLQAIRTTVRERNKLLTYYEYERRPVAQGTSPSAADAVATTTDPRASIDEALAAWPAE